MQRRHRTVHRWVWILIAVAAVGTVVLAVRARPHTTQAHFDAGAH